MKSCLYVVHSLMGNESNYRELQYSILSSVKHTWPEYKDWKQRGLNSSSSSSFCVGASYSSLSKKSFFNSEVRKIADISFKM